MKFNEVSFPHPVMGVDDSISGRIGLNPSPVITSMTDAYAITIFFDYENKDLDDLIDSGQAEFFCEVTCSNTLFRKIYTNTQKEIEFEIPKKQVKGKVSFTCAMVAKEIISSYQNKMFHIDYIGYSFEIERGDILAYYGEFDFNADINYEKLKAVSTFMEVVENKDLEARYTNVDLSKSKIEIQLPSEDYNQFAQDKISKEEKFASIFHSSIVLNSLLIALYNFQANIGASWAKSIEYRLKNETDFQDISIDDPANIPEIAQRLLGNPFRRVISELHEILELSTETED